MSDATNKAPAYPWYPRDFAADEPVQLMTLTEEGAYRRLLDHQWLHGSIPGEMSQLARICKNIPVREMTKLWRALDHCFSRMEGQPPRFQNRRLERVRQERREYRDKQSASGKLGAEAAWGKGAAGDGKRYVYAMKRASDGAIKIGVSRSPERRASKLSEEMGSTMTILAFAEGGFQLERASQVDLSRHRIGTEWFTDCAEVRTWLARHLGSPNPDQGEPLVRPSLASASAVASAVGTSLPADAVSLDVTDGQIMAAIREHLYAPDGKPPEGWVEGREFSIMRQLRKLGKSGTQILAVVEGLGELRRDGRVDWLKGKATLRAVYNSKTGCLDMWGQAEDAYYKLGMKMGEQKKSSPKDVRNDFLRAAEQYRAKAAN